MSASLEKILRSAAARPELQFKAAAIAWEAAVGELVGRNTRPVALDGRTLVVNACDQQWQRELRRMSGVILTKISAVLGTGIVEKLDLRIGQRMFAAPLSRSTPATHPSVADLGNLPERANCIDDGELRELALRVAARRCITD